MNKIRIAVLCPSEIAFRRFMPALQNTEKFIFVGIGHASSIEWFNEPGHENEPAMKADKEKAEHFVKTYGGRLFDSYFDVINSDDVDAVYIPLPPGLHYKWGKLALEHGKHLFLEKPFTTNLNDTKELIKLAELKNLACHENYMFVFHNQINEIKKMIDDDVLGDLRLIRISFGFPFRGSNDFRYNKKLGGGALLDCGGYTLKLASLLLGNTTKLVYHKSNFTSYDVDIYGSGVLINDDGLTAQVSFGMDNSYKCELEVWGSKGQFITNRILTAPCGYIPTGVLTINGESKEIKLSADDTFKKSIEFFEKCIYGTKVRKDEYSNILLQSSLVDEFMKGCNK